MLKDRYGIPSLRLDAHFNIVGLLHYTYHIHGRNMIQCMRKKCTYICHVILVWFSLGLWLDGSSVWSLDSMALMWPRQSILTMSWECKQQATFRNNSVWFLSQVSLTVFFLYVFFIQWQHQWEKTWYDYSIVEPYCLKSAIVFI